MPGARANAGSGRVGALAGALAVLPAMALLWGFTVDDALIPARYAHHLATGRGYVFNAGGPATDGVTPLGFAQLLAPFAGESARGALAFARALGLVLSVAGAAAIGWRVAGVRGSAWKWSGLVLLGASAPFAAWAGAGLETGTVAGLVAIGIALRHGAVAEPLGAILMGVAAGMRPELLPFAVIAGVPATASAPSSRSLVPGWPDLGRLALVIAPFVAVVVVRMIAFGRPTPLAALAKQTTSSAGLTYAAACFILTGPAALFSVWTWHKTSAYARWLLGAVGIHFVAIGLAGGDWMPLSRLAVAVLPAVALVAAEIAAAGSRVAHALIAAALALEVFVWTGPGWRSRRVMADRTSVMDQAAPVLRSSRVIASLDVGWVGAAAPDASVLDLAGVTDPIVAALPGGHTQKPIPDQLIADRKVDTIVMLVADDAEVEDEWTRTRFSRGVERWLALSPFVGEKFELVSVTEGRLRYVILRRKAE